jgi:hypothetical protein
LVYFQEAPKSLLKSNNPVEDVIELDDEEMEEDEDSVQVSSELILCKTVMEMIFFEIQEDR